MDCTIQNAPIPRNVQRISKDKRTADFMYHPEDNLEWVEWEEDSEDRNEDSFCRPTQPDDQVRVEIDPGPELQSQPSENLSQDNNSQSDNGASQNSASSLYGRSSTNVARYLERVTRRDPALSVPEVRSRQGRRFQPNNKKSLFFHLKKIRLQAFFQMFIYKEVSRSLQFEIRNQRFECILIPMSI